MYFGTISLTIAIIYMPMAFLYVISRKHEKYESKSFENTWGSFYEGVKTESKSTLMFNFFYMMRRVLLVYAIFMLVEHVTF